MDSRRVTRREALGLAAVAGLAVYLPRNAKAAGAVRPEVEADTLFLLDPAIEKTLAPGHGGMIPNQGADSAWQSDSKVREVPGRFRTGLKSYGGYLTLPLVNYLPAAEWTVEASLASDVAWADLQDSPIFALHEPDSEHGLEVGVGRGQDGLTVSYTHQQAADPVAATLSAVTGAAADQWISLMLTLKDGTLRMYVDDALIGERTGLAPPRLWADEMRGEGFTLCGYNGRSAPHVTISDMRISRAARVPGQAVTPVDVNEATVSATVVRPVRHNLTGGVHFNVTADDQPLPALDQALKGMVTGIRTDKGAQVTPMKVGAPDTEHPTLGHSGLLSYDWGSMDRVVAHFKRLGAAAYINHSGTPSILGGKNPPTPLIPAGAADYNPQVPNDLGLWGAICEDLTHHITVTKGLDVAYWGVGNEPETPGFWQGTLDQYLAYYEATWRGTKRGNPAAKVCAPDVAHWNNDWVEAVIRHGAQRGCPPDAISWHSYLNDLTDTPTARAKITRWAKQYGIPDPELICSEWAQGGHMRPGVGAKPWADIEMMRNDWGGAWVAAMLQEFQAAGMPMAAFFEPFGWGSSPGWGTCQLADPAAPRMLATGNAFRLFNRLGADELGVALNARPGVFVTAAKSAAGIQVLATHLRYREDVTVPLAVKLPGHEGKPVAHTVIDKTHANVIDGAAADLVTVTETVGADGTLVINLLPRSIHLLEGS